MSLEKRVKKLEEQLHQLRSDFERRVEFLEKGPYSFNYRDLKSEERYEKFGCCDD